MSWLGLRLTPPAETYDGFKFRVARVICLIFGAFAILFFGKHAVVWNNFPNIDVLPEPFRIIWHYLLGYYFDTATGALELLTILAGFCATFWLNLPKQYFAGEYRDYGKRRVTAEAQSLIFLAASLALLLVLCVVPFLTLHFPVWISFLIKYSPVAAGVLRYLSVLPEVREADRAPNLARLDWEPSCFDATYNCARSASFRRELEACDALMRTSDPEAARRFLVQGSTTVTWSGVDALFNNLEACTGISADLLSLHKSASEALEFALGELLDSRGANAPVILTTDAEDESVRCVLEDRLSAVYRYQLEKAPIQSMIWSNAPGEEVVSRLAESCLEVKPDIVVLSHVFGATGFVLDLKELVNRVRKERPDTIFVVDGSHALGNVELKEDTLLRVGYYGFNGHNWLLGAPSVGLLYRNAWLLRVIAKLPESTPLKHVYSALRPDQTYDKPPSPESVMPWFALNYVLKTEWLPIGLDAAGRHTRKLAMLFRAEMQRRDLRVLGNPGQSSVVVVAEASRVEDLFRELTFEKVCCTLVTAETGSESELRGIRFSFHHYHDDENIRTLAEFIGRTVHAEFEPPPSEAPQSRAIAARA